MSAVLSPGARCAGTTRTADGVDVTADVRNALGPFSLLHTNAIKQESATADQGETQPVISYGNLAN